MRDGVYETDPFFHTVGYHRVRQDLVDPLPQATPTDQPVRDMDDDERRLSVRLDPNGFVAFVSIAPEDETAPGDG